MDYSMITFIILKSKSPAMNQTKLKLKPYSNHKGSHNKVRHNNKNH